MGKLEGKIALVTGGGRGIGLATAKRFGRPLRERRARLEAIVTDNDPVLPVRRLARNGFEAWSEVVAHDYEGYVAKDESGLYEAGLTRRRLRVKQKGWTVEEDRWQRRISSRA